MSSKMLQATWITSADSNTDVSSSTNVKHLQQRLQTEVGLSLEVFDDVTKCVTELERSSSIMEKRILILEANVANEALPLLQHLCNVVCIFVYCMNFEENLINSLGQSQNKYKKIMVLHFDDLIKRVQAFSERWHRNATDFFSFATSNNCGLNRSSTNINSSFLFSQLLVDLILRMKPLETDRKEFCDHCLKIYQTKHGNNENNVFLEKKREQIRDFQADIYSPETTLKWYTKDAFLYDIVNHSFRTSDVETIFHSRFPIREMHQQLMRRQIDSAIRVYRGQQMSNTEVKLLHDSIGERISMRSFLSTSLDQTIAEIFAGVESDNTSEDIAFVIFIIDAIPNESNKAMRPFGDITDISHFKGAEKEILFMVGSVFRITSVAQDSSKRWIISMTMCDQEDIEIKKILSWLKDEQNTNETGDNPYYDLANLLLAMNMPNEVLNCFHNLQFEYSLFPPRNNELTKFYYILGKAELLLGLEQSCNSWSEIPTNLENLCPGEHNGNGHNRNDFALSPPMSFESSHLVKSLQYFEKALDNIDKTTANYHFLLGSIYHSVANTYRALTNFEKALNNYENALENYLMSIPKPHRLIAELYADLGRMYYEGKKLPQALVNYQYALGVAQTILPDTHPEMGVFHMGLAVVYAGMGQNITALVHICKAANIDLTSLPNDKPPLSSYYGALDIVYEHKESMNSFQANKDNMHGRQMIQQPNVKWSWLPQREVIFYQCPWCSRNVWVYRALDFLKGSPCFQCLQVIFTLLSPQLNLTMALILNYFVHQYSHK